MNKAHIISALFIGFLAALLAAILWLPLALGNQVCEYSEPNRILAFFEFSAAIIGLLFILYVIGKLLHSK